MYGSECFDRRLNVSMRTLLLFGNSVLCGGSLRLQPANERAVLAIFPRSSYAGCRQYIHCPLRKLLPASKERRGALTRGSVRRLVSRQQGIQLPQVAPRGLVPVVREPQVTRPFAEQVGTRAPDGVRHEPQLDNGQAHVRAAGPVAGLVVGPGPLDGLLPGTLGLGQRTSIPIQRWCGSHDSD